MNPTLSIGEPWMWAAFIAFVLVMLVLDLFVFGGRKAHKVGFREAAPWHHLPVQASQATVAVLIGASVIASLIATRSPSLEETPP